MNGNFIPRMASVSHVGRHIKSTKIRYNWEFELENKKFQLDLYISRLSGKRKISINGTVYAYVDKIRNTLANYILSIGGHKVEVTERRENFFELIVDGCVFECLLENMKYFPKQQKDSKEIPVKVEMIADEEKFQDILIQEEEMKIRGPELNNSHKTDLFTAEINSISDKAQESDKKKSSGVYVMRNPYQNVNSFESQYSNISWGQGKFK
ncbi:hypothetical protein SteCoe_22231 [Stentor coeruleus]|uniref:Uncharacterized protein n=1 Tax=Stentor coeruleus TaxID=5963 RepID=A0A1R2BMH6_9CILI|nr:hypothetical protein SteCoe_22231 [Stentor coeruleus]